MALQRPVVIVRMIYKVVHVVEEGLPKEVGYTLRTQHLVKAQRELGIDAAVVVEPRAGTLPDVKGVNRYGVGVRQFDAVPYYRLSDSSCVNRFRIRLREKLKARRIRGANRLGRPFRLPDDPWRSLWDGVAAAFGRPSVVHAHMPHTCSWSALSLARCLNVPFVYEVRGLWELSCETEGVPLCKGLTVDQWRARELELAQAADCVITLGDALARELVRRGVDAARVRIVPNGVDGAFHSPNSGKDEQLVEELELGGEFVAGYMTNVRRLEGVETVIHALAELRRQGIRVVFVLVGDGPDLQRLKMLAQQCGVADLIRFIGRVSHDEIGRYYSLLDVFVVPRSDAAVCRLVTPLKPLEAMARGKVVLASDLPALRECITDGHTGLLFRAGCPASLSVALMRVRGDTGVCERLARNAREWVSCWRTWELSARRTEEIYCDLLKGGGCSVSSGRLPFTGE